MEQLQTPQIQTPRLSAEEEEALRNVLEDESGFFFDRSGKRSFSLFRFLRFHFDNSYYAARSTFQRIFRSNHLTDVDIGNLDLCMAKWIYPRIKAFVARKRHGYPGYFSEYNENEWKSREEYDEAIRDGRMIGGGAEAWDRVLQEILFAFEWKLEAGSWKTDAEQSAFFKKWALKNPHEKNLENKRVEYVYDCLDPDLACCISEEPDLDKKEPEKYQYKKRQVSYYNAGYDEVINARVQAGFEAFGKYFQNFWN